MRLGKQQRQHLVARLIEERGVGSQSELVELLGAEGVEATQATVSRDLEELGALKVRAPGGESVYALPEVPVRSMPPHDHLRRVLGEWVVEVASSQNVVVLRTPPGCAHVVASALDRSTLGGMIGTVAGDDTVLVVASEEMGGNRLACRLAELAGAPGAPASARGSSGSLGSAQGRPGSAPGSVLAARKPIVRDDRRT